MINEPHHITLTVQSTEDFECLVKLLGSAGFNIPHIDTAQLTVECHVDDLVLALAEKFLDPVIIFHNRFVPASRTPFISEHLVHKAAGW